MMEMDFDLARSSVVSAQLEYYCVHIYLIDLLYILVVCREDKFHV